MIRSFPPRERIPGKATETLTRWKTAVLGSGLCQGPAFAYSSLYRNPLTNESVFDHRCVKDVLSIMFTCGMYDYSGQWAYQVGVPAKSGVSGGVMAVVNRQLGVATYSPLLDRHDLTLAPRQMNAFNLCHRDIPKGENFRAQRIYSPHGSGVKHL